MKKLVFSLIFLICLKPFAQDTLPKFSAATIGNDKVRISWTNPYPNCTQISVQKSYDSLKFFQTIFSSLSPELPQNGYVDNHYIKQMRTFYRIFYVLENGKYFFTKSKRAGKDIITSNTKIIVTNDSIKTTDTSLFSFVTIPPVVVIAPKMLSVYRRNIDTLFKVFEESKYAKFKDSITRKTKDTLFVLGDDKILWKPFVPKPLWKPSINVFTADKGYVSIVLPNYKTHHYKLVFYDAKDKEIFRIKQLKQDKLTLEKFNFLHEGWFYFELFEDDKLKEKNKFFIEKDF